MMQFVATIGRNDPCACHSGKKYKKCCLPLHQARNAALRKAAPPPPSTLVSKALDPLDDSDDDGLAQLSNSAVDLAHQGHFEQALAVSARLLAEFPEVVDGLERAAMVHAKMGHHALAADLYRQAADFVNHPSRRDDYDDHDYYRQQAEKQQGLADSA